MHNLADVWDELEHIAFERDQQKHRYASTKNYSRVSTHYLGLLGEVVVAKESGLPVNLKLLAGGDGGADFQQNGQRFDIKTTLYWHDPHLKEYRNPRRWADYYVLVAIDLAGKRGRVVGWASQEELRKARSMDYGYGARLALGEKELHLGLPPVLKAA